MSVRTKTRRRLRFLVFAFITLVLAGAAFYLVRQRQIRSRILAGRETGYAALESGDYFTALHQIGPYLQRHEQDTEALFRYARARQNVPEPNSRHVADALSLYRRLLELDPTHREARETLLDLYVQYNLNTEIVEFTTGLRDPASRRARVIALARMGRLDEALPLAQENAAADPTNLEQQIVVLDLLRQSGTPAPQLLERAQQLHQQHPGDPRFELLLSLAYAGNQDRARALELAQRAASGALEDARLISALVSQLDALGSFAEARALLERASTRPDRQPFRIEAARRLLNAQEYQAVIDRLGGLDAADSSVPAELLALRAIAHLRLQQRDAATPLIAALADRRNDLVAAAWARVLKAVFADGQPRDADVIAACTSGIANSPDNPYFRFYLGEAYARAGDNVAAVREFIAACQLARAWSAPLNALARALLDMGQPQAALHGAQAARERAPADPDVLITLAMARVAMAPPGDAHAAEEVLGLLDQVEQQVPNHDDSRVLRVATLARFDRRPQAIRLLRSYLDAAPPPAAEALLQLASLSRAHQLGLEDQCFDVCEARHGPSADLALARAMLAASKGDPGLGERLFIEARQRAGADAGPRWRLAYARFLESIGDERARQEWLSLAAAEPDDPLVQRLAMHAPSVRAERQFLRQTIDRLGRIIGPEGIEWRLADAQWLLVAEAGEQQIARATVILNDIVRRAPEHAPARRLLAECLVRLNQPNEAIDQLLLASRLEPQSNPALLRAAALLHGTGQFDRAMPILSQIRANLARPGRDPAAVDDERGALAQLLSERGDLDEAIALLEQAPAGTTRPSRISLPLAALHAQRGTLTEPMCAALMQNPEPSAIGLVADFHASRGNTAEAQRLLARLDELDAPPGTAALVRARYYELHGSDEQVLEQLTAATQAAPGDAQVWCSLIVHHVLRGQTEAAMRRMAEAQQAVPSNAALARCARHSPLIEPLIQHEPARALIAELLDPAQDHAVIIDALEVLSVGVKDSRVTIAQSVERLAPLAQRAPRLLPLQQLVATMYLAAGQNEQALDVATRAMQRFPNEPEPARLTAQALAVLGRWPEVVPAAEQWKRRAPRAAARADALIAAARLACGDGATALATVEPYVARAVDDPARNEDILRLYLQSSLLAGRLDQAAERVEPALTRSPGLRGAWMQLAGQTVPDSAAESWLTTVEPLIDESSVGEKMMLAQAWMTLAKRSHKSAHQTRASQALERASRDLHTASHTRAGEWEALGMLYDAAAKPDLAEQCYRRALQLNTDLPVTQNNLAMLVLHRRGDLEEALALATKAAAHRDHPLCASFLDTLATVQARLKRFDLASRSLADAIARDPRNLQWRVNLVQVLADAGEDDRARAALRELDQLLAGSAALPERTRRTVERLRADLNARQAAETRR